MVESTTRSQTIAGVVADQFPRLGEVYINTKGQIATIELITAGGSVNSIVDRSNVCIHLGDDTFGYDYWLDTISTGRQRLADQQPLPTDDLPVIIPGTFYVGCWPYPEDGGPTGEAQWRVHKLGMSSRGPLVIVQGFQWTMGGWDFWDMIGGHALLRHLPPRIFAEWRSKYLTEMQPIRIME